jgi:hypothetical protein
MLCSQYLRFGQSRGHSLVGSDTICPSAHGLNSAAPFSSGDTVYCASWNYLAERPMVVRSAGQKSARL